MSTVREFTCSEDVVLILREFEDASDKINRKVDIVEKFITVFLFKKKAL